MKIAVILGSFSIGSRPLDFSNLWDSPRGLTGTDLCFIRLQEELYKLGHEVHVFHNVSEVKIDESFDAAISINEPNLLIGMPKKTVKIVWQMLNDFSFVKPGFDDYVDQYLAVCKEHEEHMKRQTPHPEKWDTVSLGCDPKLYSNKKRVSGRVLWCSSADRGLHNLLQEWSKIKLAVPNATLRILYHFNYGDIDKVEPQDLSQHPNVVEMGQRIRYMKHAIKELKHLGVEHIGSVSRNQMVEEWNAASVFGFSCDTVAFSEGFSVSTLEAHASYTVPIITDQDCLGGIYRDSGATIIQTPVKDHLPEFTDAVIRGLTDRQFIMKTIKKSRQFALQHTWEQSAKQIENIIIKSVNKLI